MAHHLGGVPVGDIADVLKPSGRYKTIYLGLEKGWPILSGAPGPFSAKAS